MTPRAAPRWHDERVTGDSAQPASRRRRFPRGLLRPMVYLLAGAAIALGFLILASSVYAPLQPEGPADLRVFLPLLLLSMLGVGLLPGVREVQVAGVQTLLGVRDVVAPAPMRARHRWRTALWTFVHQVVGTVVGLAVLGAALALATLLGLVLGASLSVPRTDVRLPGDGMVTIGFVLQPPGDATGWLLVAGAVLLVVLGAAGVVALAAAGATWSAPLLLGPTGEDRLALAERRLAEEREYRRLSRDLHDGVGHSLSAISLQAAAARRVLERGGEGETALRRSLEAIESLSGRAVGELDRALGVLRRDIGGEDDPAAARRPVSGTAPATGERDLHDLGALVAEHRSHGADVRLDLTRDAGDVPAVVSRTAYRVCAEAVTNAVRHGDRDQPVRLRVATQGDRLEVTVVNRVAPDRDGTPGGRGLTGLREEVALVGGSLTAGPGDDGVWCLVASMPHGGGR